jgi:hypothetical protein
MSFMGGLLKTAVHTGTDDGPGPQAPTHAGAGAGAPGIATPPASYSSSTGAYGTPPIPSGVGSPGYAMPRSASQGQLGPGAGIGVSSLHPSRQMINQPGGPGAPAVWSPSVHQVGVGVGGEEGAVVAPCGCPRERLTPRHVSCLCIAMLAWFVCSNVDRCFSVSSSLRAPASAPQSAAKPPMYMVRGSSSPSVLMVTSPFRRTRRTHIRAWALSVCLCVCVIQMPGHARAPTSGTGSDYTLGSGTEVSEARGSRSMVHDVSPTPPLCGPWSGEHTHTYTHTHTHTHIHIHTHSLTRSPRSLAYPHPGCGRRDAGHPPERRAAGGAAYAHDAALALGVLHQHTHAPAQDGRDQGPLLRPRRTRHAHPR